jgi:hypothetical protein
MMNGPGGASITGKPFPYRSDDATAVLEIAPEDLANAATGTTYRLSIAR